MMGVNRRLSGGKHDLKGARKNPGVESPRREISTRTWTLSMNSRRKHGGLMEATQRVSIIFLPRGL